MLRDAARVRPCLGARRGLEVTGLRWHCRRRHRRPTASPRRSGRCLGGLWRLRFSRSSLADRASRAGAALFEFGFGLNAALPPTNQGSAAATDGGHVRRARRDAPARRSADHRRAGRDDVPNARARGVAWRPHEDVALERAELRSVSADGRRPGNVSNGRSRRRTDPARACGPRRRATSASRADDVGRSPRSPSSNTVTLPGASPRATQAPSPERQRLDRRPGFARRASPTRPRASIPSRRRARTEAGPAGSLPRRGAPRAPNAALMPAPGALCAERPDDDGLERAEYPSRPRQVPTAAGRDPGDVDQRFPLRRGVRIPPLSPVRRRRA